jgi:ferritin-like metal-binding protein YciE
MTSTTTTKIIQYLSEAHATELALVRTLQAHIAMTPRGRYRTVLDRHLSETRAQAAAIERRLGQLGEGRSLLESTWDATLTLAQGILGQALALSKGPIDVLRGDGGEEKLLKNAKDECATEALEIATYDALEQLARRAGDTATAELAAEHRGQEERMLADLRALIPSLVDDMVRAEVGDDGSYDATTTGAADAARDAGRRGREVADRARATAGDAVREVGERAEEAGDRLGDASTESSNGAQEPWRGYDTHSATEVRRRLARASRPQAERVRAYERAHRDRATVLRAAEQKLNR